MTTLILYDSLYGNTKRIAEEIARAFKPSGTVKIKTTETVTLADLKAIDMLFVGSPTHGGRAKPSLQKFLDGIPAGTLNGIRFAAFDTRFLEQDLNFALKLLVRTIGYAAPKIASLLQSKGGIQILPPEGFIIKGKEGPLTDGELKRANAWAKRCIQTG